MIDNDLDTVYEGTVKAEERTEDAQAVISLGRIEAIAGVKYTYKEPGSRLGLTPFPSAKTEQTGRRLKKEPSGWKMALQPYILTRKMTEGTISMMQPM